VNPPPCERPGCTRPAVCHVRGTAGTWDVCNPDLGWAQKLAGVPRTTTAVQVRDDGQEALFDMPKVAGKKEGLR
jgi:hypothetical protein